MARNPEFEKLVNRNARGEFASKTKLGMMIAGRKARNSSPVGCYELDQQLQNGCLTGDGKTILAHTNNPDLIDYAMSKHRGDIDWALAYNPYLDEDQLRMLEERNSGEARDHVRAAICMNPATPTYPELREQALSYTKPPYDAEYRSRMGRQICNNRGADEAMMLDVMSRSRTQEVTRAVAYNPYSTEKALERAVDLNPRDKTTVEAALRNPNSHSGVVYRAASQSDDPLVLEQAMAHRHSDLLAVDFVLDKANKTTDPEWKREYTRIAATCPNMSDKQAENFAATNDDDITYALERSGKPLDADTVKRLCDRNLDEWYHREALARQKNLGDHNARRIMDKCNQTDGTTLRMLYMNENLQQVTRNEAAHKSEQFAKTRGDRA